MDKKQFYSKIQELIPWNNTEIDFRHTLNEALNGYNRILSGLDKQDYPSNWNNISKKVSKEIKKLKDIVRNSYKGLPSTAGQQMKFLLKEIEKEIVWTKISSQTPLYRMRIIQDKRSNIDSKEMFHIPINKRREVRTQRYSTPGYPCLYLGLSLYGCWEELGRPVMSECWVSRLENECDIELLDLRIPSENTFVKEFERYLVLAPLIIACMIPVPIECTHKEYVFKPEYIVPQLIVEWIIKKKKDGVIYTSTHKSNDFDYTNDKNENVAIPIKQPLKSSSYCSDLRKIF